MKTLPNSTASYLVLSSNGRGCRLFEWKHIIVTRTFDHYHVVRLIVFYVAVIRWWPT